MFLINRLSITRSAAWLACGVLVVAALSGCGDKPQGTGGGPPPWVRAGGGGPGATGGPPGGGPPMTVLTKRVAPQSFVDRFTALGTARANESIEVTSRTSSIVTRIGFSEGQRARAGQILVELDTRQEKAALRLAEAQLKQAESQYRRSQALADTGVVSAADLDQLEANLQVARAQVAGAQAKLDTLFVRAPFDGRVGLRRVSLGDLVGPDTIITTLDDTGTIKLEFAVPESFIADLRLGMVIEADTSVYPGRRFKGTVRSIDSRVDPVTRAVTVVATVPNGDGALKPGMFLSSVLERSRDNVLLIPEEALVPREGRQFVFVVTEGKALEKEVQLGGRSPGYAEVRTGLDAGDLVITEGTQRVRNGAPVQASPAG